MHPLSAFCTERIRLRPFEPVDVPALHSGLNHPELAGRRYLPRCYSNDFPLSVKQVEGVLEEWSGQDKALHLAVELLSSQELAGYVEYEWEWDPLCPFVSVLIFPPFQRQSYGAEAARLLLRIIFENSPAHNISAWMSDWNQAALEFTQKLGFQVCGRFRRDSLHDGQYSDGILMDLLRPEWMKMRIEPCR
jgi:RimJ/RimL family protein N-acetyltransferase